MITSFLSPVRSGSCKNSALAEEFSSGRLHGSTLHGSTLLGSTLSEKIDHGEGAQFGNCELSGIALGQPVLQMRVGDSEHARLALCKRASDPNAKSSNRTVRIIQQINARVRGVRHQAGDHDLA